MNRDRKLPVPYIRTDAEVIALEKACRIVAETLTTLTKYMKPGVSTLEIDKIAEDYILSKNARPACKGYRSGRHVFPATLCISVNEEIVHGIPGERKLVEGDIVTCDCVAEYNGYYGDSSVTYAIGEVSEIKKKLMKVTEEALFLGIDQAIDGNKLYDICGAIQKHVEDNGFSVTRELVGHGIGTEMHEEPAIPNFVPPLLYRRAYPNYKLVRNNVLAIEPMVHAGTKFTREMPNGWTFITADGMPAAHFEHTVVVDKGKARILTLRD